MKPFLTNLLAFLAVSTSAAEPFRPNLGPEQERITVRCGEVTLLFRQASQWTPGRIDFRGAPMTTERSAYGTVFSFPDVGFIGTAHLENEPEPLKSISFFLDGSQIEDPEAELVANDHFRFERVSRVRDFHLRGVIEIKNDRLYETATVSTTNAVPLKLVYHFMHAWRPTVSAYLAGRDGEASADLRRGGLHDGDDVVRKFYLNEPVDWIAVYEPESSQFAVSRILETPEEGTHLSMIWNVPGTYRKYYLKCFSDEIVPAGFNGTWRMVTGFGQSDPASWESAAQALAAALTPSQKKPIGVGTAH